MTLNARQEPATAAYIGLGSNIEDRHKYLTQAVRLLNEHADIFVSDCSGIYETDPVGFVEQSPFLNMVIRADTLLSAEALLAYMMKVEQTLGRTREIRWGPRTIDLDLLLYGSYSMETPELTVPHPRMFERAFVMIPLLEILPDGRLPRGIESFSSLAPDGKEGVTLWKSKHWPID